MPIATTNVDEDTDSMAAARVQLKLTIDKVNELDTTSAASTIAFMQMAVSLIDTQTIVVEHHAFS